jgi:ABC-type siderophore export system fused ATPase/permease subunit
VFITRGNGSGKTTLAKLLCGLYAPDEGALHLDGEPIAAREIEAYRVFREQFYEHILPRLRIRGKTVLVVTHDERYAHVADRVIKLEYGRLVSDIRPTAAATTFDFVPTSLTQ